MLHGGELAKAARDYGIEPFKWLDLSTGINPNGYAIADLPQSCFHHLPDPSDLATLENCARVAYGVPKDVGLIASPGSECLIQALPQTRQFSKVAILSPTFSSHEAAWRRYGHEVTLISRLEDVSDQTVVVVVNPNNPDGSVIKPKKLKKLARGLHEKGGLLVIDEAFADVMPGISYVPLHDNGPVIVLRSVGKFYGLAGIRLGFAVGPNRILQSLRILMGDWAVSGPAIEIGKKALADTSWREQTFKLLGLQSAMHRDVFDRLAIKVVGGLALFNLIEVNDARTLHHQLAKRAIWTRRFDYNPQWLRVGLCKSQGELKQFEMILGEALNAAELAA